MPKNGVPKKQWSNPSQSKQFVVDGGVFVDDDVVDDGAADGAGDYGDGDGADDSVDDDDGDGDGDNNDSDNDDSDDSDDSDDGDDGDSDDDRGDGGGGSGDNLYLRRVNLHTDYLIVFCLVALSSWMFKAYYTSAISIS